MYFVSFQDLFNKMELVLSIKVILCSKAWKNSKSHTKKNKIKILQKQLPELFSVKTIDPICFMKPLWSISAHWCFQKIIASGLALWRSDTPQSISYLKKKKTSLIKQKVIDLLGQTSSHNYVFMLLQRIIVTKEKKMKKKSFISCHV